jgi:hypothetical protein
VRFIFVLGIAFLAVPTGAFGDIRRFTPRIYNNEGELETGVLYDYYKNTAAGRGTEATDTFIYERFTLTMTGYVYHPRFIQFLGKFSAGFNQEKFTQTGLSPSEDDSWNNTFREEYELRALVLPEHPYNLELYTLRKEPFIRGLSAGTFNSAISSSGAIFKYKERPYNFFLSYDHTDIESRTFTADTDSVATSGSYTKEWGSFWAALNHAESNAAQTQGIPNPTSNTVDTYSLGNYLNFWEKKVRLTSTVTENRFEQTSSLSTVNDDRRSWTEQLNLDLPWSFDASLSYRYSDDDQTTRSTDSPMETTLWSENRNANMVITQRLYQSLVTSYSYNYFTITTSGGDSTSSSQMLTSTYRKRIPRGYFNAGIGLGRSVTEGSGAPTVINENHNARIFDEFTLQGSNIEETSIAVTVRSAQTGNLLPLAREIDYIVIRSGVSFRIRILSVPTEASSPDPLFQYEFRVTYSLASTDYKLETTNAAYNLRLDLFDRLFNPYYNYSRTDKEVVSGNFPGGDETVTINTVGATSEGPFFTLLAEYQDYDSNLNPTKTFRAEGSVWRTFRETTNLSANAYYMDRQYLEVPEVNTPGYTETTLGGRARGEIRLPRRNLTASLSGNYWQTRGVFTTKSMLINALLTWKIARLDVALGAVIGHSETDLRNGIQKSDHNVYYLTIKRKLFGR